MTGLLPNGKQTFIDANGNPLAMGTVAHYVPGTTTPKDTYQDQANTILNTNPVKLDASGRAVIWGSGTYRQVVLDNLGNVIWDQLTGFPDTELTSRFAIIFDFFTSDPSGFTSDAIYADNYVPIDCIVRNVILQLDVASGWYLEFWKAPFVNLSAPTAADKIGDLSRNTGSPSIAREHEGLVEFWSWTDEELSAGDHVRAMHQRTTGNKRITATFICDVV